MHYIILLESGKNSLNPYRIVKMRATRKFQKNYAKFPLRQHITTSFFSGLAPSELSMKGKLKIYLDRMNPENLIADVRHREDTFSNEQLEKKKRERQQHHSYSKST